MTEDASRFNSTCGAIAFLLGLWASFLGVLNIAVGAYVGQKKVVWAGFLTMGTLYPDSFTSDPVFRPMSDTVFMALSLGLLGYGVWKLNQTEGGIVGWIQRAATHKMWLSLFSTDAGAKMTAAAWCILLGEVFYLYRGFVHWNWVDVGVYSITIALVGFGFALKYAAEVENAAE